MPNINVILQKIGPDEEALVCVSNSSVSFHTVRENLKLFWSKLELN